MNKLKTPGHGGFPLANPHSGESVYIVPAPTVTENH